MPQDRAGARLGGLRGQPRAAASKSKSRYRRSRSRGGNSEGGGGPAPAAKLTNKCARRLRPIGTGKESRPSAGGHVERLQAVPTHRLMPLVTRRHYSPLSMRMHSRAPGYQAFSFTCWSAFFPRILRCCERWTENTGQVMQGMADFVFVSGTCWWSLDGDRFVAHKHRRHHLPRR